MPQIAIPDTLRVVAHQTRGSEEVVNVFHVQKAAIDTDAEFTALSAAFGQFYGNASTEPAGDRGIADFRDATVDLDRITIQDISAVPYTDAREYPQSAPGTATGDLLPLQTSLCVTLRTGTANRRGRGRVFLGGFGEGANSEATDGYARPSTALMAAVANAFQDLLDNIQAVAVGADLGVASFVDLDTRAVTSIKVKNVWSTQRRRTESVPITASTIVTA